MTKNSVGWPIAINVRIGFKLQVAAMPAFHSLYDWYLQTMWLLSGRPADPVENIVLEKHVADRLYSAVKGMMHGIRIEEEQAKLKTLVERYTSRGASGACRVHR